VVAEGTPVATVGVAVRVTDGDAEDENKPVATVGETVCVTLPDDSPVAIVRVTDGDSVFEDSPVAIVRVTDCVRDTVSDPVAELKTVAIVCVTDGDTDTVCVTDVKPVAIVAVTDSEGVGDKEPHGDTVTLSVADVEPDRHSVALPDSDTIVADAVGVSRFGAQNGPMLYVARCVPSIEYSVDPDATTDGDAVADARTVATVGVTVKEGLWDADADPNTDPVTDSDAVPHSVACDELDRHGVALPESDAIVADAVGVDTSGAQNGPMLNVARCVPLIEKSGDNDAMEAEPVTVARPVATVRVTDGDTDTVAVRRTVTTVGDTDTVCE